MSIQQQTALQYDCLAYLLDGLAGDVVSLLFADFVVHSRRAGRIFLPGQKPEDANEAKDIED